MRTQDEDEDEDEEKEGSWKKWEQEKGRFASATWSLQNVCPWGDTLARLPTAGGGGALAQTLHPLGHLIIKLDKG